jgi:hypothetical protein
MLQEAVEEFDQLSKSQVHSIARVLMCVPFDCGVQECSRMFKRYQESMALFDTFCLENCGCSLQSFLHQAEILQGLPELVGDLHL